MGKERNDQWWMENTQDLVDWIKTYVAEYIKFPTRREIVAAGFCKSSNTVTYRLGKLEELGIVESYELGCGEKRYRVVGAKVIFEGGDVDKLVS